MGNEKSKGGRAEDGKTDPGAVGPDGAPLSPGSAGEGGGISGGSGGGGGGGGEGGSGGGPGSSGGGGDGDGDGADGGEVTIPDSIHNTNDGDAPPRAISIDDFELLKVLGKGSFGKVMLVRKIGGKDVGKLYALKTLRKETLLKRNQIAHTRTERSVLQVVDHPFIISLKYAFQTRDKLYLVTDYAPGGELFFWLKRERVFSQARVRLYAAELVLALEHLHSHDVVYRDLKPENILLDGDGHIKLTDFGLSKEAVTGFGAEGGTKTFCGTPEYLAPEILENKGHGKAVDWWSLGTLLYEMCAGLPPFYDTNMELMYEKILTAELAFPRHFLAETRDLLAGMLERDVTRRLGYNGAEEIKSHPFFRGISWDDVYHCRYVPLFKPPTSASETDVRNFEEEFTRETPVDSVDERGLPALSATQVDRVHFEGFTFVGESSIGRSVEGDKVFGSDGR